MQAVTKIRLSALGFVLFAAASATSLAADTNSFQVNIIKEPMHGREPVIRAYVTSGSKRFTFAVPEEYRLDVSKPSEVVLISSDYSSFITLRIAGQANGTKANEAESYRRSVLAQFADTEIIEELSLSAAESSGPAFDVRGKTSEGLARNARIAYIPCDGRVLEFSLVASPEKFRSSMTEFHTLMQTFRVSDANTKAVVATFSDRI